MAIELIVAEKPKVAEKIAYAIGKKVKAKKVGKVSYYETERDGNTIYVAPAVGHVYSLAEKKKSSTYPAFDIEWKPAYEVDKDADYTKAYVDILEMLGKKADIFVSACDYDLEGSLIAYNVFRYAVGKKEAHRMKFSTLTDEELEEAFENMGDLDYANAMAGETRHLLDWYYGINLSRALMGAIRAAERYKVMSIGRVQGPALALLSELERKIAAFKPTPYWELSIILKGIEFQHGEGRFEDENEAKRHFAVTGNAATVDKVEKKEFQVQAQPNFDLTTLQVEAYRVFGFTPKRTLDIAQSLYEASLISYPRTSSQKLPDKLNPTALIKKLASDKAYEPLVHKLLEKKWLTPQQGKKEDPAHPAIHPVGVVGPTIKDYEKKLHDLIARRFLASFAPPATKERTHIEVDSNGEPYKASGTITKEKGWIEFYGSHYKAEDNELPPFSQGETLKIEEKKKTKKETQPPKRYSEASIVSELESRKLGTKATRATIIETLFHRGYAQGKSIKVSDFGLEVHDVLAKYAPEILDEHLTRKIEEEVELIQEGKIDKENVLKDGREILVKILDKWKKNERKIGEELIKALKISEDKENTIGKCDKCGGTLRIIRMRGTGKQFIGCKSYPNCHNAYPLPGGAYVTVTDKLCPACGKPTVNIKRFKARYSMCIDPNCPTKEKWKTKSSFNKDKDKEGAGKADGGKKAKVEPAKEDKGKAGEAKAGEAKEENEPKGSGEDEDL